MNEQQLNELIADARDLATQYNQDYYVVSWRDHLHSNVVTHEQLIGLLPISAVTVHYSTAQDA